MSLMPITKVNRPIVTVSVWTYNSSKYVLETLESIKAQTYPNMILQICDDCSTDKTVEICNKWIDKNKERFVKTKIIIPEHNTGISGNANRAWDACETEWHKGIAGDDLLFSNCIEDNMEFINHHPEAIVVFSRVKPFKVHKGKKLWNNVSSHDYGFFRLSAEEQYHYLLYIGNHLPAAPCFCNISKMREIGIRHDERIPLLEDYPKWIMFARKGIHFYFMDKFTVGYRINDESLSVGLFSPLFFKSNLLFYLYYYQDEIKREEERDAIYNLMCDQALKFYTNTYLSAIKNMNIVNSWDYKIGHLLLFPLRCIKHSIRGLIFFKRHMKIK